MSDVPEKIWLQWDVDKYEFDSRCVTWCDSPIPEAENIEYIRSPQWVLVSERNPDYAGWYQVGVVGFATSQEAFLHDTGKWNIEGVYCWLSRTKEKTPPLPAPPEAQDD